MRTLARYVVALAVLVVPLGAIASTTTTQELSDEQRFLTLLNRERTSRGKPALRLTTKMRPISREWSDKMRLQGFISHRPDLVRQVETRVTTRWLRLGENVGVGSTPESLNTAFMNSTGHRANVLGDYNYCSVGVQRTSTGRIYVTVNFIKSAVSLY
jgi:uncharacterized protein YkwD